MFKIIRLRKTNSNDKNNKQIKIIKFIQIKSDLVIYSHTAKEYKLWKKKKKNWQKCYKLIQLISNYESRIRKYWITIEHNKIKNIKIDQE
jgi:hypothetical protein